MAEPSKHAISSPQAQKAFQTDTDTVEEQPSHIVQSNAPEKKLDDMDVVTPDQPIQVLLEPLAANIAASDGTHSGDGGGSGGAGEDVRKKRKTLSVEERGLILEEYRRRKKLSLPCDQRSLSLWAFEMLRLGAMPSQSTISRILTRHERNPGGRVIMRKGMQRNRPGMHPELERALYCWIQIESARGRALSWEGVKVAGERMLNRLNERLPEGKRLEMKFSSGWLQRFQERMGIKGRTLVKKGEGEMGSEVTVESVKEVVAGYELCDIFAADEFGHCFDMGPGIAVSGGRGKKKGKGEMKRLVYLGCVSADGGEKAPLYAVGETGFHVDRKEVEDWGVWYQSNRRGWLSVEMFHGWLVRFGEWIGKESGQDRKVLVIVDGWNGHGGKGLMPEVQNVEVVFLDKEGGDAVKPFENGIARGMKVRYRKAQVERAMDMMDIEEECGGGELFDVDAMTGIQLMKSIWDGLPAELVRGSWRKTGLLEKKENGGKVTDVGEEWEHERQLMESIGKSLKEVGTKGAKIDLERFVSPEEEVVGVQEFREEDCVQMAFDEMMDVKVKVDEEGRGGAGKSSGWQTQKDTGEGLPSLGEQLKAVVLVKHLLQREGGRSGNGAAVKRLKEMQVELRKRVADERKQSGLKGFLRPHWMEGGA